MAELAWLCCVAAEAVSGANSARNATLRRETFFLPAFMLYPVAEKDEAGQGESLRPHHRQASCLQVPQQHSPPPLHRTPCGLQQTPVPPSVAEQVTGSPNGSGQQCDGDEHAPPMLLQQTSL